MTKKKVLGLLAVSLLMATLTGCGSSCRPGTDCDGSGTPPDTNTTPPPDNNTTPPPDNNTTPPPDNNATPTQVVVSDAYVLQAMVTASSIEAIEVGNGVYEWTDGTVGTLMSTGGANDLSSPIGEATEADPVAVTMSAPSGYKNINPFTTMLSTTDLDELAAKYPASTAVASNYDFDVVTAGNQNLDVAKEVAKAALSLSCDANPDCSETGGGDKPEIPDMNTSCNTDFPLPGYSICSPSLRAELPGHGVDEVDNNNTTPPSDGSDLDEVFKAIDAATNSDEINSIVLAKMMELNGPFKPKVDTTQANPSEGNISTEQPSIQEPVAEEECVPLPGQTGC